MLGSQAAGTFGGHRVAMPFFFWLEACQSALDGRAGWRFVAARVTSTRVDGAGRLATEG